MRPDKPGLMSLKRTLQSDGWNCGVLAAQVRMLLYFLTPTQFCLNTRELNVILNFQYALKVMSSSARVGKAGSKPRLHDINILDEWKLRKSMGLLVLQHGDELPTFCYACGGLCLDENDHQDWVLASFLFVLSHPFIIPFSFSLGKPNEDRAINESFSTFTHHFRLSAGHAGDGCIIPGALENATVRKPIYAWSASK